MGKVNTFVLPETIKNQDYVLATYYIVLDKNVDVIAKAEKMAIGQTIGTWVPVPGITDEMRENHMGKIVSILDAPPYELSSQINEDNRTYFIQIAYPTINFGAQFPMMLTTLLGNDASTSAQVKLVDVQLPKSFVDEFKGPKFGIEGLRELTGVNGRPLVLNMIKPCTGLTPQAGAKIFYDTALGGLDFIKDDELLGNTVFSPIEERVKAYNDAAKEAAKITGKEVIYIPNVTDSADRIWETVDKAINAGAKAIMMSFSAVGFSLFRAISEKVDVPVMGHYASSGAMNEGINSGLSSHLTVGKFPRLAGADLVMMNTPYGGYPLTNSQYFKTYHQLVLPYYNVKPSMAICGGGVHPGMVPQFTKDFGLDIILAAGGSVQGHPNGAKDGAKAMVQAAEAMAEGISLDDKAKACGELKVALERFGKPEIK